MRGTLVGDALDRTFLGADRRAGKGLDHFPGPLRVADPLGVEIEWTGCNAFIALLRVD